MNDHKEHISQYSAADIQRYVQGKLSAAEMHAMEKAALDDPFLADAIEGYQQAFDEEQENVVTGQIQQLQQQFNARTNRTARVVAFKPFRYWQAAAAAAVVFIITGVWLFSLNKNAPSQQTDVVAIAKTEQPQQQSAPSLADSDKTGINKDSISTTEVAANTHPNENKIATGKPKAQAPKMQESYKNANVTTERAPVAAASPQVNDASTYFAQTEKKEVMANKNTEPAPAAAPPVAMAKAKALRMAEEKAKEDREAETELITIARSDVKSRRAAAKDKNLSGFIKGQVTDPFNNPVANAYVQVQLQKATNNHLLNNLTTDKYGYFKIPVSDSVVDVAVNVSGYGTQNFTLQNNAALNQLQLQPANYSDDYYSPTATINNKKQLANNYKFPNVMLYDAEPAYGWIAFGQYLEKNKIIPAGAENITGNVIVSFEVNKKGALSDYKIEQSLSKAHDEEAIRLIKQGPSWKLRSGRKARITVMVKF
ncbi:carboxypeptidase regulatory-like domain-containing protein [Niastella sp. OAS944]|uniref:carboxypeptidase regulatory-like domain-containing protein n=1 Tax=Niastella sp. OAS944 TaxID=2664089 RepID=UPI0034932FB1|nr:TonB family protein [Chitinophagaceae bacterium OAS944]